MSKQLEPYTLGKRACEVTLAQILNENPAATRRVTNLLNEFREGLQYLRSLDDYNDRHFKQISLLWFEDFKKRVEQVQPVVAAKHLHACIKADWRAFLQEIAEAD